MTESFVGANDVFQTRVRVRVRSESKGVFFFDAVFHGAAASGSTKIRTRFAIKPVDGVPVTQFHTVQGTLCREVEIFVNWRLHDAHRDGLVVSALEPHPIVQVIDWEWFRASLARVKCSE